MTGRLFKKLRTNRVINFTLTITLFFLLSRVGYCQPATDVFLFDLITEDGKLKIINPVNISNRKGYDNQPFFHPDKPILYYVSADDEGRTDIIEYTLVTNEKKKFTNTKEKEYSPTVTPDKKFISCILQHDNGAQNLVKYPIGGGQPILLIDNLTVGYHAWLDDNHVLIFVLGEPNTLRLYTLRPKGEVVLAQNIGRSLHRIPGSNAISFVHKLSVDYWNIKRIKETDGSIETITQTLPEKEDLTWTPDGKILMSDGVKIFFFEPEKSSYWNEIEIRSPYTLNTISRLAVNRQGDKIAVVINE